MMERLGTALSGLRVVDLGRGLPTAIAVKLLAELGASVIRFEPADEPFADVYPAYRVWQSLLDTRVAAAPDAAEIRAALDRADMCICGGEDFPDYDWAPNAHAIAERHPHLILLEIEAYPGGGKHAGRPGVEILVQARSGISFEQFGDRPVRRAFESGGYGAALHGLCALLAGLCARERDGKGRIVRSSLLEGALTTALPHWYRVARPSGSFYFTQPKNPHPLIFRCRDGRYVHFVLGSFGSKGRVYRILGIDDPSVGIDDSGLPTGKGDPKNFYGDVDVLAAHVARFDSDHLLREFSAAGVAANLVLAPGECWDDPQVAHLGLIRGNAADGRHVALPMRGGVAALDPARRFVPSATPGALPLAGVRVIDYGLFVAGPYGSMPLVDLGADVIKVEAPQGEPGRNIFRSFAAVNRGKRSIAIDMKTSDGAAIARRLAAGAQVLHNNFRPGVSARLGVDAASQRALDADKIVLESTGCGHSGPSADSAGFDMIYQAFCGHEVRAGGIGNPPMWDRSTMVDYHLGLLNAVATLVALWRRYRGAGGADLELTLLDAGVFLMSELVETAEGMRSGAPPLNANKTGYHPAEALYRCADGWIAIAARDDAMAARLAATLAIVAPARASWTDTESAAIAAAVAAQPAAEVLARLERADIWSERCVEDGDRILVDPSDDLVFTSDHPVYGELRQLGALFRFDGRRHMASGGSATLGADTRTILSELGYSAAEIDDLYVRKIVG